jgi:hypothetical protein
LISILIGRTLLVGLISWPIAYLAMRSRLQGFAYRTSIGAGTFILATILAVPSPF